MIKNIYKNLNETQTRIVTAVFMFLAVFLVFIFDYIFHVFYFSIFLTTVIFIFCAYEFTKFLKLNEEKTLIYLTAHTVLFCFILFVDFTVSIYFFLIASIFWIYIFFSFLKFKKLGLDKFDLIFSIAILLFATLGAKFFLTEQRNAIFIPLLIVWINDIGAYFFGKKYGKHKLMASISPGKSIEGALGGIFFCIIIVGSILIINFELNFLLVFFVITLLSLISIVGDLTESYFKRIALMKDSGTFLPGHGGFLDRLDSLLAVLPTTALFFQLLL